MCLIIHKPANKAVPMAIIESALQYNDDGFGLMLAGKVSKWTQISAEKIHKKVNKLFDRECAIHFRMATHGWINHDNTHPFPVHGNRWLMHNGVFMKYTPKDRNSELSDTRLFIRDFLNPLIAVNDGVPEDALRQEIAGSAILLMGANGEMRRYGSGWNEHEGLWFSNQYAWDCPTYKPFWRNYASTGGYAGKNVWEAHEANFEPLGIPSESQTKDTRSFGSHVYEPETCDDIITSDLVANSDDIDLTDDTNIALSDTLPYSDLLAGTLTVDEFIYTIGPETKLALYCQLITNGVIR